MKSTTTTEDGKEVKMITKIMAAIALGILFPVWVLMYAHKKDVPFFIASAILISFCIVLAILELIGG